MSKVLEENDILIKCRDSKLYGKVLDYLIENERDLELYIQDGYQFDKPFIDIDDIHQVIYIE